MLIVLDLTPEEARRLADVLRDDCNDAGYDGEAWQTGELAALVTKVTEGINNAIQGQGA